MTASLRLDEVSLVRSDPAGNEAVLLNSVSAAFDGGAVTVITGATGAGKSTLIHILGGLLRPTSGTVFAGQTAVSRWVAGIGIAGGERWASRFKRRTS